MDFHGKRIDAITSSVSFEFFEADAAKLRSDLGLSATPQLLALAKLQGGEKLQIDADRRPPAPGDALFYLGGEAQPMASREMCKQAVLWARKLGFDHAGMAIEGSYAAIGLSGQDPVDQLADKLDAGWRAQKKAAEVGTTSSLVTDASGVSPALSFKMASKLADRRGSSAEQGEEPSLSPHFKS